MFRDKVEMVKQGGHTEGCRHTHLFAGLIWLFGFKTSFISCRYVTKETINIVGCTGPFHICCIYKLYMILTKNSKNTAVYRSIKSYFKRVTSNKF